MASLILFAAQGCPGLLSHGFYIYTVSGFLPLPCSHEHMRDALGPRNAMAAASEDGISSNEPGFSLSMSFMEKDPPQMPFRPRRCNGVRMGSRYVASTASTRRPAGIRHAQDVQAADKIPGATEIFRS